MGRLGKLASVARVGLPLASSKAGRPAGDAHRGRPSACAAHHFRQSGLPISRVLAEVAAQTQGFMKVVVAEINVHILGFRWAPANDHWPRRACVAGEALDKPAFWSSTSKDCPDWPLAHDALPRWWIHPASFGSVL